MAFDISVTLELVDRLTGPIQGPIRQLQQLQQQISRVDRGMEQMMQGAAIAGAGAVITAPLVMAATAASDLAEGISKSSVVFKEQQDRIMDWSKSSATAFGLSRQAAMDNAATLGHLMVGMNIGTKSAADMSMELVGLAADMASLGNTDVQQAVDAIKSGILGESEPLSAYGVKINQVAIQRQAFLMGLTKSEKDSALSDAAKAMAIYGIILEKTSKTTKGDFARNQAQMANATRILQARVQDSWANIGQAVLPTLNAVIGLVNAGVGRFNAFTERHPLLAKAVILTTAVFGGLLVVGGGLLVMVGAFNVAWGTAAGGLTLLNLWYNRNILATYRNAVAVGAWTSATNMSTFAATRNATGLAGLRLALIGTWTQLTATAAATWAWVTSTAMAHWANLRQVASLTAVRVALMVTRVSLLGAATAAWGFTAALLANPVTWVVLGVVALGAALYGLYRFITGTDLGKALFGKFLYWTGYVVGSMKQVGTDLVMGLMTGIWDAASDLWDTVTDFSETLLDQFTDFFGIRSPSRLFAEQGGFLVEGIQKGMEGKSGGLFSWLRSKLGPGIMNALSSGWNTARSWGGAALSGLGNLVGGGGSGGAGGVFDVNSIAGSGSAAELARSAVNGITAGWAESIPGYCSRFVRQVFQKTLGPQTAKLFGSSAIETERIWKSQGLTKTLAEIGGKAALKAGDVLFQGFGSGGYGHTAVYLGNGKIAHNTTANGGGKMISSLDSFGAITSVGRLPSNAPAPPRPAAAPRGRAPITIGNVNLPNVREPNQFLPALQQAVEAHQ